jgi:hypothetical protein
MRSQEIVEVCAVVTDSLMGSLRGCWPGAVAVQVMVGRVGRVGAERAQQGDRLSGLPGRVPVCTDVLALAGGEDSGANEHRQQHKTANAQAPCGASQRLLCGHRLTMAATASMAAFPVHVHGVHRDLVLMTLCDHIAPTVAASVV